tara:strand:+ start:1827 stop:2213 length:387 start_codon:yes stop_codon:yes gene_type:complete
MGLFDKIKDSGEKLSNLKEVGVEKVKSTLKDFENALPIIKKAGYNLNELNIGVGVPPSIIASFNIKKVSEKDYEAALDEIDSNKVGKAVLKALIGASKMKEKLEIKSMTMNEIHVEIGLIPKVNLIYS